eukprot:UN23263
MYTSGTTGRPKGVVWTHRALNKQIDCLLNAWHWKSDDHTLHTLPLHHIHGIVNNLLCPLKIGAQITFTNFEARNIWERFTDQEDKYTIFMGVPTMYTKLIHYFDNVLTEHERFQAISGIKNLRLMISGSAALPLPIFEKWKHLTGYTLLERYGMTEIGMALSNPYENERIGGTVGFPLPGVEVKMEKQNGELLVRSEGMFNEYWNNSEATEKSFTKDGYFKTGDIVQMDENNRFSILGRESQDIIKCFGFKVSALEIERELFSHEKYLKQRYS